MESSPGPDQMRTPKSSRVSRRRSLFPHLEEGMDSSPTMSPSSKSSQELTKQLPANVPRRSLETVSSSSSSVPTEEKVSPIKKSTFYGNSKTKYCPANSSASNLDSSFQEKMALKTPPKKANVGGKKNVPKSAPALRSSSSRKKDPPGATFGLSKGVSHGIKKPKLTKAKTAKRDIKSPKTEDESNDDDMQVLKNPKAQFTTLIKLTPSSSKTKPSGVSYQIKNGQVSCSILRRSPRKSPKYFNKAPPSANLDRIRTPKRLFSPASRKDFLGDWQASPPRSGRKRALPSPVKHVGDDNKKPTETNVTVNKSVNTTDNELSKVTQETIQQMEVIDGQKVQVDIIGEIQGILANIVPPTESEVKENRCNYELELEDSSNDGMIDSKENTPQKLFPMFEHPGKKSLASKENTPTKSSIKLKTNNNKVMDDSQMIIDAGQKNIGVETCVVCNFIYNPRNAQDERAHKAIHSTVMGVIKFNGWKNEHNLGEFHDGRIIVIKPNDPKVHWDKAESVLEIIDKQLGCIGYAGQIAIRNRKETKVYFFISANRIVGFLLAEEIGKHDLLSLAAPNPKDEAHKEWLLHDLDLKIYSKVVAGISRIWVSRDFRRLNIATRLVQAMEVSFIEKKFLKKGEEYAFSHTTPDGSLFASKYTSPKNGVFLAYAPILAGFPVQI